MTTVDLNYWKHKLKEVVEEKYITSEVVALRDEQNKLLNLMAKKNHDYNNAFNKGCDELGIKYGLARLYDKINRLNNCIKQTFIGDIDIAIKDESMIDTIKDLANYCTMILAWFNDYISHKYETITDKVLHYNMNLVSEYDHSNITSEIVEDYGVDCLVKDKDGYVYNQNSDGNYISVTDRKGNNVIVEFNK